MGSFPGGVVLTQKSNLLGGRELQQVRAENPMLANLLRRVVGAINTLAENTGQSPTGQSDAPPAVGAVNVKASGGVAHVTIADDAPVSKPIEYFVEHDTNPNFTNPHVQHLVSGRGAFLPLPSKNDAGDTQHWYFRAYSQYPGSQPSAPVYFGGLSPTGVDTGGATQLTPLTSTGSGTASPTGQQGGWGRGKIQERKRNVQ
jgi:hypothetical protein